MDKAINTDESIAMISANRVSGHPHPLVGTSIAHSNTIKIRISRGEQKRDLHRDWFYAREPYIEVEMSLSQWAEFITSLNMGDGVPCTLSKKDGRTIPEPQFTSVRGMYEDEFRERSEIVKKAIADGRARVQAILEKKNIGKADREEILQLIESMEREAGPNLSFIGASFNEQMDKTVMEAKGEVEGFVENKLRAISVAAISQQRAETLAEGAPIVKLFDEPEGK